VEKLEVQGLSLGSLIDQSGFGEVDLLKMDIEGGEYEIITLKNREALRRVRMITLEYHDETRQELLWGTLDEVGFKRLRYISN